MVVMTYVWIGKSLTSNLTLSSSFYSRERAEADVRVAKHRCTVSRLVSREDVDKYWARFRDIFPEQEEAVWDALYRGLTKYYSILQGNYATWVMPVFITKDGCDIFVPYINLESNLNFENKSGVLLYPANFVPTSKQLRVYRFLA